MGVYYWIYNHDLDEQIDLSCCANIKCSGLLHVHGLQGSILALMLMDGCAGAMSTLHEWDKKEEFIGRWKGCRISILNDAQDSEGEDSKDVGLLWLEHLIGLGKFKEYLSAIGYIPHVTSEEKAQSITDAMREAIEKEKHYNLTKL